MRGNMPKINGWLRLWIVLSLVWTVITVFQFYPSILGISDSKIAKFEISDPTGVGDRKTIRVKVPLSMSEEETIKYMDKLSSKYGSSSYREIPDFIEAPYLKSRRSFGELLRFLMIPIISMLLTGLAFTWVRRGFK
jgi:hypothetical protein